MNSEPVTGRRLGIGLAVAVALLTSGCAAGQVAATANVKAVEAGVEADAGTLAIRGLLIQSPSGKTPFYAAGDAAYVTAVFANAGTKADRLTGVTSTAFSSWGAFSSPADAAAVASPAASSSSASSAAQPKPSTSVEIAPGSRVSYGVPDGTGALLLLHAKQRVYPGSIVTLTLTFANAGSVTVRVPVHISSTPNTAVIPNPSGTGAG